MGFTLYVCDECEDVCISSEPDMHECTRKSFLPMTDTVWRATSGISDMMDMAVESHKATMEDLQDDDDSCAVDMQVDALMDRRYGL